MNSKELIKKILRHEEHPRIGFCFSNGYPSDIEFMHGMDLIPSFDPALSVWGRHQELLDAVGGFSGEVKMNPHGNIYGRFDEKTKGECLKGALQDGWELLDTYRLPTLEIEAEYLSRIEEQCKKHSDRYQLSFLPCAVFAPLRDTRHMDNALMDILLEPENVCAFLDRTTDLAVSAIPHIAAAGADGAIIYDDLGMQHATFFSPNTFRELFKPYYKKLADALHAHGLDFFVHSCGRVTDFIEDFIDAGVDAFQFDQPELHGSETLASRYGNRATFFCPVDIQTIMPTGDREVIESGAIHMVKAFQKHGGSLIVMDYANWQDINVLPEWQIWASEAVIRCADIK